jgi:hypothetical protein
MLFDNDESEFRGLGGFVTGLLVGYVLIKAFFVITGL